MNFGDNDPEDPQISIRNNEGTGRPYRRANSSYQYKPSAVYASASTPPSSQDQEDGVAKENKGTAHATLHPSWNTIFVIACALAVSLDPLFFYIPIINEDRKCLEMDSTLKASALVLRSVMDITFVVHIVHLIYEAIKKADKEVNPTPKSRNVLKNWWDTKFLDLFERVDNVMEQLEWRSFLTDIFCLLPIPQVLLVVVFFRMKGNGYLNQRKVLSFFLLIQYVARVYRIFLSSQKFSKSAGIWVKGLFNFFLYVIASHVFGAFWYFFAVQRETSCWHRTCGKDCSSSFYCDKDDLKSEAINNTISTINSTCHSSGTFNYGIFKDALTSHNTESRQFIEKLCYCFWWGLRNLSNFGTNLSDTSNYPWENCFAILVSISGLLIFVSLIGNVQTFMQMQTLKSEEIRVKIKTKGKAIRQWMTKNGVPKDLMDNINTNINQKLEENKDADLENLFAILPWHTRKALKRHLCMDELLKIPMLSRMDEKVMKMICDYMKPVIYPANEVFVQAGGMVDRMILITEGELWVHGDSQGGGGGVVTLKKGDFYGAEQLLSWAEPKTSPSSSALSFDDLPRTTETARCHTKLQGFLLSASDLKAAAHKCRYLWKFNDD